ncbi:MAG TPA: hypothetical protein VMT22_02845 [Terriglobales bacterium]|nr:hypothetical protein [Terriglobales bacterium]
MQQVIGEHYPDSEIEEVAPEFGEALMEPLAEVSEAEEPSMPAPPYSALMMPASRAAQMAVLDENGYLVPVCTAGDILRSCRYFWRAAMD